MLLGAGAEPAFESAARGAQAAIGPFAEGSQVPSPMAPHDTFATRPAAQKTTEPPSHFGSISLSHSTFVGT